MQTGTFTYAGSPNPEVNHSYQEQLLSAWEAGKHGPMVASR